MPKQTDSIELTNSLQGTVEYTASQEIIPEEKILEQGSFTYTSNGERTENPSEGYDGFSQVAVNVNVQPTLQSKSVSYTENNDYTISPDDGYQGLSSVAVNVNVPQGGSTEAPENDVEFIDYDGTIVYSYTAQEFLALDAMPANPTHEGLTAQGWNWSLADAKEYVGDYGGLVIGQMYATENDKTYIYINLDEERKSPYLGLCPNGTAHVEWGDGGEEDVTGTSIDTPVYTQHTYANAGDYVIKITPPSGDTTTLGMVVTEQRFGMLSITNTSPTWLHVSPYLRCIKGIALGGKLKIPAYAFGYCYQLEFIIYTTNGGKSFIGNSNYMGCYSLKSFICTSTTQKGIFSQAFATGSTPNIKRVSFFGNKNGLTAVACSSLFDRSKITKITFPYKANNLSSTCYSCDALKTVILPNDCGIGQSAFSICYALKNVNLPNKPTIPQSAFSNCQSLAQITIPDTVTTIQAQAFINNLGLAKIIFRATSPASVANSDAFNNLPTDCKIYVPYSEDHSVLNAYKTATNYPNPSTYTYVEY